MLNPTRVEPYRRGLIALAASSILLVSAYGGHSNGTMPDNRPSAFASYAISGDEQLDRLTSYKEVLNGQPPDGLMVFAETPANSEHAESTAQEMARQLKTYARYGLTPYVIMEPTYDSGAHTVDFNAYAKGQYDRPLVDYFQALKRFGVTDKMLGVWVSFPEANSPAWGQTTDPAIVGEDIARTARIQKSVFPRSQAGVMFNSMTYPNGKSWENGRYSSLLPYAQHISRRLIDSVGLQGFPYYDHNASFGEISAQTPDQYLNAHLATEAAQALGSPAIWFNTGTLKTQYAGSRHEIHVSALQRQRLLNDVLRQAELSQRAGFDTTVNLFADDKSHLTEKIDWSYMQDPADKAALESFAAGLRQDHIRLSIFDAD